jgi:hypothetical protein
MSEIKSEHRCEICDKKYKTLSGLWKHNRKNHRAKQNKDTKTGANEKNDLENEQIYKCKYCDKSFKYSQSKYRHQKTCKNKNKKKVDVLPVSVDKMETTINNSITNNINTTNTTNNIMIVNFGEEKPLDYLTERDKLNILKQYGGGAIEYCVKIVHYNDRLPQFRNIETRNLKDKYCSIYRNGEFITALKNECYEEMIGNRVVDIDDINQEYQEKVSKRIYESINNMCDKVQEEEKYMRTKMEKVRLISHNDHAKKKKRISIRHQKKLMKT